ncbi:hypothetical protein DXD09_01275 [Ligilactobacillus ruminis]|uniref:Vitamin B12-binding protein n=1 Tax=Ligilactobacillus ruminis TaxID=1623 RepID=A0A8B2Z9V4_9LACO|nr:hypothetical protein DXD09_01275 [Ligilactobacillus ruminis]
MSSGLFVYGNQKESRDCRLRANLKNWHFARNQGLPFTGKFQKTLVLPVTVVCHLRANFRKRPFCP